MQQASFDSWLDKTTFLNSFDNFDFSHTSPLTPPQYTIMESSPSSYIDAIHDTHTYLDTFMSSH